MPTERHPRKGSMQVWPRVRAPRTRARIRTRLTSPDARPLAFAGYKVGMTHVLVIDNLAHSETKGAQISYPVTIVECPPLKIYGLNLYKKDLYGMHLGKTILAVPFDKELSRVLPTAKKSKLKIEEVKPEQWDDARLLVHTQPKLTGIGKKKPELFEVQLGGTIESKIAFAKENFGKELQLAEVFKPGQQLDVHAITKAKGVQGVIKRYGVTIKQHKTHKGVRGVGSIGPWHPARVLPTVPRAGKMGWHQRIDYNKWLLKIGTNAEDINRNGGFANYPPIKNPYMLIKGTVPGSRKRLVIFTQAIRPNPKWKEAPAIAFIKK